MPIPFFRALAIGESITWIALICASIFKRVLDMPELTQIAGPIHGIVFLMYAAGVLYVRDELRWPAGRTIIALVAALIPLGTYLIVERNYLREASAVATAASTTGATPGG